MSERQPRAAGRADRPCWAWGAVALGLAACTALGLAAAPAQAAFIPGQAKRLAPGPFAAAPMLQGGWANGDPADMLTFPTSTQVSGLFYRTLDANQGSIVFWIRPEWNGGDGKRHDLFHNDVGNPGALSLRVESTGFLIFRAGANPVTDEVSVDVSGWVAGQTHLVVARWDNDNALAGGSRLGLSIDDVHTFSTQTSPPAAVGALSYVGSDNTGHYPANAIIEGFTIYRRPLFDGAAGIDVGNGDEISLIYSAGGQDPSFVTGSWDVVFSLPTDSTTGALTSGSGQAWSHPYGSELLPGNSNTGGFMLAGAPATDGWSSEGAPTSVLPLAAAEKVFAGGYKVASNAANQGIYQDITVAAGNDWVARALVHSDGTCQPRLVLYDETGAAAIGSVAGTTTSTRTAPDALLLTGEAPAGSTTLRVKLVNAAASGTCFWHQAEVLANSVNNPSMQRWQATTPVIPSGWTNESMDAGAPTQETTIVHSGTYAFRFQGGPDSDRSDYSLNVGAAGAFYAMGVYSYWLSGQASFPVFGGTPSWLMEYSSGNYFEFLVEANPNVWRHRAGVARRRAGGDPTFYVGQYNLVGDFIIDDFYAFPLSPIALTVTTADLVGSKENTNELRVDGRDVWLVPGVGVTITTGTVTFNWRPRHSAASGVAFVENSAAIGAYLVSVYGDANNWIDVYWDAANRIRMRYRSQGNSNSGTWNATGAIVAGTQYAIEVAYAGGFMTLKVDGITRITIPLTPANFGVAPTNVYYGSDSAGANQGDATFSSVTATAVTLQSFAAAPGDGSVLLEWRTASELDNLGFHLYRGLSTDGPWTRLTASLIPGLGSSALGQAYSFRDTGLVNGTPYFYRLEDVDASSQTTSHGPVVAVPAAGAGGGAPGSEPATSGGSKPGLRSSGCPASVLAAYAASTGSDAATASLRCTRHGDPEAVSLGVLSRDARSATLELRTGGFYALHTPPGAGEASGTVRVFVPGFDLPQDAKAAALPFRRALVDAVVGRGVRLAGVRASDQVGFRGLVPSALGAAEMQVSSDGTLRAGRRAARPTRRAESERVPLRAAPTDLARLLPSAFQGETKSAVLLISPLRYDARQQQIVLTKRVRVRLLFTGREAGEIGRGRIGRRERPQQPASGERLARLFTTRPGLYAVAFEQLFPGQKRGMAASELCLERQGEAVAFHLEPASGSFGPGSVVYFHADSAASSTDFSAEVAYELVRSRSGGQAMPLVSATPEGETVSSAPLAQASFEVNRLYQPGLLEAPDPWLWDALASGASKVKAFSLARVDPSAPQAAELEVFLQGASESGGPIDHHVSVSLNGVLVGEGQFAGKQPYRMSLAVPASLLREGANELELTNVADTGVSSLVFLDRFTLVHPQAASLAGGRFEGTWSESGTATVAAVGGPVAVVDVTGPAGWLTDYESAGGSLRLQVEAGHRYRVVSQQALGVPRVAAVSASTLRAVTNRADWLLIAPRGFLGAAGPLVERRRDQGLAARAVAFEDIADEFGHGQPSAEAIRSFIAYAFQSWARPSPRYVVLLGDASYDPRHFMTTSLASPLPVLWTKTSYLWTASDPLLAAVNGDDDLPDLAIGRLPATTVEQAELLVGKLIAWEESGQGLAGHATLVADNPDLAGDFEANAEEIADGYLRGRSDVLRVRELGAETRGRIEAALDGGLAYLGYVGHGGSAVWASENVWNSWDAASLREQSLQPLLVTMNCLNGYFVAPSYESLSESLLKAQGRGAIAAFSPSGLSLDGPAHAYHEALMGELTSGRHERLGDAILAAQQTYAQNGLMPELVSVYHLLGDPAMSIR